MAERKTAKSDGDASGVTEHDDNYLGVAPEYQNSAYLATAPIVDEEGEDEVAQRVREHEDAMAQPANEVKSFEEWYGDRQAARQGTEEVDLEAVSKDELMEEARELDVEGRSSMNKEELAAAVETARQNPS